MKTLIVLAVLTLSATSCKMERPPREQTEHIATTIDELTNRVVALESKLEVLTLGRVCSPRDE